jgi:hypothetical protein
MSAPAAENNRKNLKDTPAVVGVAPFEATQQARMSLDLVLSIRDECEFKPGSSIELASIAFESTEHYVRLGIGVHEDIWPKGARPRSQLAINVLDPRAGRESQCSLERFVSRVLVLSLRRRGA